MQALLAEPILDIPKDRKRRDKLAVRACVLCNQAHTACDDVRPCKRCVSKNIAHLCRDAEPRKRGRPAKSPEQYDLEIQMAQRRSAQALQVFQSIPLLSLPSPTHNVTGYNFSLSSDINLDYDPSMLDIPLSPALDNLLSPDTLSPASPSTSSPFSPSSSLFSQMVDSPPVQLPEQYTPMAQQVPTIPMMETGTKNLCVVPCNQPQTITATTPPPAPASNSMTLYPPGFSCLSTTACTNKFSEEHLIQVFHRLALRAGYNEITPDIRGIMNKVLNFYAPLVQQYGPNIMDMCPVRLMSVSQMINENSLPVVVAGCFFMITANAPAHDLTGLKKADLGKSVNWRFIFDIIHKDDAIAFVKRSVDSLTSFSDLDRMKVRLLVPEGVFECVVSETIHRNANGVPLFSSFTIIRIDDLH